MKSTKMITAILACTQTALLANGLLVDSQNKMRNAKQLFTTILRNKNTSLVDYRKATDSIASILACEAMDHIALKKVTAQTQLAPFVGLEFDTNVVLVPILRSGLCLLPTFLRYFETARVDFVGLARDEQTAQAHWYYKNFGTLTGNEYIIILDPMLATGGTAVEVLRKLKTSGANMDKIIFVSVVCAPDGIEKIKTEFPNVKIITVSVDTHLNDKKFIVPGLGDFGDRYFGTE